MNYGWSGLECGLPGSAFGPGPWENEPGRSEWRYLGMPCLLRRNHSGVWCGYVAVDPTHPRHGKDYDVPDVEVHGGLTYSGPCEGDEGAGICHVPQAGEDGNVWWFGFDCDHSCDLAPTTEPEWIIEGDQYRTMGYARKETENLAEQLLKERAEWISRDA